MELLFLQFLFFYKFFAYALIFLLMLSEGDIVLFSSVFLAHQGFLEWGTLVPVLAAGMILGDVLWYWLGAKFAMRAPFLHRLMEKIAPPFDRQIQAHLWRTILVSKFAYGIHRPILLRIGSLKIPFWRYLGVDLGALAVWAGAIALLGIFSSASISSFKHVLRFAEIGLLIGVAVLVTVDYFLKKFLERSAKDDTKDDTTEA